MLKEMKEVSPSIHNYEEYINKFLELSPKALMEENKLKAAYYLRGAIAMIIKDSGYEVICFDGPVEDYKMPMTHEWEKPVKTILDFFQLGDVTLLGISLGSYFVLRAAQLPFKIELSV